VAKTSSPKAETNGHEKAALWGGFEPELIGSTHFQFLATISARSTTRWL
jgi:hypothetical protein